MKHMKLFNQVIVMIMFFCLMVIGAQAQSPFEGFWAGGSSLFGSKVAIQAHIEKTPTGLTGHFSAPAWNAAKRAIGNIQINGTKLRFEFPFSTMIPFVCQAELKDEILQGTISRGSETGNLHLVRAATLTQKQYDEYVGGYRAEKGVDWLVTWGAFGKLRILSLDGSGDALIPMSENRFFLGRSVINSPKPDGFVAFSKDEKGRITQLIFKIGSQPEQKRTRAEVYNWGK